MPAYVIVDIEITDPEQYERYKALAPATVAAYGGRYVARGGATLSLEGDWQSKRLVILEFDSLERAQAWAQQLLARAQGDAAAFDKVYGQYKLSPEVTKRRMYYETMERVLGNNDKVIVEAQGVTTYLPLPEIKRKAAAAATASEAAQGGQ